MGLRRRRSRPRGSSVGISRGAAAESFRGTGRGAAAAATWIFRGDGVEATPRLNTRIVHGEGSRRRRGRPSGSSAGTGRGDAATGHVRGRVATRAREDAIADAGPKKNEPAPAATATTNPANARST